MLSIAVNAVEIPSKFSFITQHFIFFARNNCKKHRWAADHKVVAGSDPLFSGNLER